LYNLCNLCFHIAAPQVITDIATFLKDECVVVCSHCFPAKRTIIDMQACVSHLTTEVFGEYIQTMAEPVVKAHVAAAAVASAAAAAAQSSKSQAVMRAESFLQLGGQTCPSCRRPFWYEHGCAALKCDECKAIFCMWCRAIGFDSRQAHLHPFECPQRPHHDEILLPSCLVPCNDADSDFIHSFYAVRNLRALRHHMQTNMALADQVEIFNTDIVRTIIGDTCKSRDKFRISHPAKLRVLRVPMHRILHFDLVQESNVLNERLRQHDIWDSSDTDEDSSSSPASPASSESEDPNFGVLFRPEIPPQRNVAQQMHALDQIIPPHVPPQRNAPPPLPRVPIVDPQGAGVIPPQRNVAQQMHALDQIIPPHVPPQRNAPPPLPRVPIVDPPGAGVIPPQINPAVNPEVLATVRFLMDATMCSQTEALDALQAHNYSADDAARSLLERAQLQRQRFRFW